MNLVDTPRETASSATDWNSTRAKWLHLAAIFALCGPLFFFRLGAWAFFDADEGRYGEIPRAMIERGDFITPMLNGVQFFDKPPLLYWGIAGFYKIFGFTEGAARLVPALAAVFSVWGAWLLGRKMFGPRAGFLSGVILATSLGWPILGRVVLTDMLVSSLIFLATAFWWLGRAEDEKRVRFGWNFGFWTALGLGFLAKGPVAAVLTFGAIAIYLLLSGEREPLRRMNWIFGILWAVVIAAPWFIAVQLKNPAFFKDFWIDQNFGRFMGKLAEQDHANGPFYFFQWIPIMFFPWSVFAVPALFVGRKKLFPGRGATRSEKSRAALYLVCAALVPPLFFSLSSSKLVTYIFCIVPCLAVLLGGYFSWFLERNGEKWNRALATATYVLAALALVGGIAAAVFGPSALAKVETAPNSVQVLAALFLLWSAALVLAAQKFRLVGAIATTAVGFCLVLGVGGTGLGQAVGPNLTTERLVEKMRPGLDAGGEIVSLGFTQSLSFYSGKRTAMVDRPDELRAGINRLPVAERERWFLADESKLQPYMHKSTPVYLVLRSSRKKAEKERAKIDALGGDFAPVARNARFTVLGNLAAREITPPDEGL
ncbi:MAG TPA: glycosyltransferase family 39 protein [Abditibacterium sp.]|jgi:4-amino-4-deoxy-L-arabinose transferase-like glycosyltransferase